MRIKSIRFKTTLLYSGILLVILVAYNIALFFSIRAILINNIDEQLRIKAGEISNILEAYEQIKNISSHPMSALESMLRASEVLPDEAVVIDDLWRSEFETLKLKEDYIDIFNAAGETLIHSRNVTKNVNVLISKQFGSSNNKICFRNIKNESLNLRAINLPVTYKNLTLRVQVATPLDSVSRFIDRFIFISSGCIIIIIGLTSFLGGFFVRHVLTPVVTVTKAANNISHMDLGTRISGQDSDFEMRQLIDAFNAMIERLEKSFIHINEFNSYVAHELKTPLAIVRGELELAIEQAQEKHESSKILSDCLEEIDRMIKIINDLLLLAKLDYKPQILKFEKIDFKEFFQEISEHGTMLASEKKIKVISDCPQEKLFIYGDKVHLRRLFLNIITNAIKFTSLGGEIHLSAIQDKKNLHVDISDTGEGIDPENLDKIFEKFFRVDKGENSQQAGFGLGLSIALSIAKAHQGNIKVRSKFREGTTFTVILPLLS